MKRTNSLLLTFCTFLIITACSRYINPFEIYQPIPAEKVYELKRDSTTRQEVEALFGTPARTSINERGNVYTYTYFGDTLAIQFNNESLVNRFNFVPELFRMDYENMDITNRIIRDRVLRRVIPGRTRLEDLTPMFGRPNRGESGQVRKRTTYIGRDEDLIVYSTFDGVVIDYEVKQKR